VEGALLVSGVGDHNVNFAELQRDAELYGCWVLAGFDGWCPCGEEIEPGDEIRMNDDGEWERRACCG
jgi:hypothetical protein